MLVQRVSNLARGDHEGYVPEAHFLQRMLRATDTDLMAKYDTWALGCVYLEFIVWIFGGFESVKRFAETRREQPTEDGQFKSSPFFPPKTVPQVWIERRHPSFKGHFMLSGSSVVPEVS